MAIFKNRTEKIGVVVALISAIIFGLYPPASRGAYLDGANITFVILVTTFCRMASLYIFALWRDDKPFQNFQDYKISAIAGTFQAISIIGLIAGSFYLPGAVVITIMFSYALLLLVFSVARGEMRLTFANASSTIFALLGLGLVMDIGLDGLSYPVIGIALAFMAAVATFARAYIYGKQSQSRHPITIGAEAFVVAFTILLALCWWQMPQPPETLHGLVMTGLASLSLAAGSFGMFYGIALLGAYKFGMLMKLEPIFTTLFGIWLVQDHLNTSQYVGVACVILSLIALQLFDKQKA